MTSESLLPIFQQVKLTFKTLYHSVIKAFDNELYETSGYVSYTILLAMFPFLILLVSVAAQFGRMEDVQTIIVYITEQIPPEISADIIPIINSIIYNDAGSLITFSIIGTLWVASSGIESMRLALNRAYEAKENRFFLLLRLQSIVILIVGVLLVSTLSIGFYLIPALLGSLPQDLERFVPSEIVDVMSLLSHMFTFSKITTAVVSFMTIGSFIWMLYRGLPNHKHNIKKPLLPGCLLATGLCLLFSSLFAHFVRNFAQYHTIYKSLGGVIVFLLFIQFSTFCILLGAQFNTEMERSRRHCKGKK